jgi:molybdate transport system regulatory protein
MPAKGSVRPRIRLVHQGRIALGPGKADLLEALEASGSLAQASRDLGMSYMRAWSLVRTMNAAFRHPLVSTRRGGQGRGGTALTPTGRRVLALYRRMEARSSRAMEPEAATLRALLRASPRYR